MAKQKEYLYSLIPDYQDYIVDIQTAKQLKKSWKQKAGKNRAVVLDVGMGRGQYLLQYAQAHPEKFFIGIEIKKDRAVQAAMKFRQAGLKNVCCIIESYEAVEDFFGKAELDEIVINCPDPKEKKRREKHRATHPNLLKVWKHILKVGGEFRIKTDHRRFFEYSLLQVKNYFDIFFFSLDFYRPSNRENIGYSPQEHEAAMRLYQDFVTEYEEKWLKEGRPFYVLRARKQSFWKKYF